MEALLDEKLIVLGSVVKTAEECILLMGELFREHGYVNEGYAQAVVIREAEYPTGLPGKSINIAIPHTNSALVNKAAVGVIIPHKPVTFHMMGQKDKTVDCELIMPLVIQDSKQQLGLLKRIMKLIQDGELLQKIRDAKTTQEVIGYLSILENPQ